MIRTLKDGFDFTSIVYPFNLHTAIIIKDDSSHTIEEYANYIRMNKIEQAAFVVADLCVLRHFPDLKYLKVSPSYRASDDFSFSPLYEMPEVLSLHCINQYGSGAQYLKDIDYSQINGLINLTLYAEKSLNYNKIDSLKSLRIGGFEGGYRDLSDLFCSRELDTLELNGCKIESLNGIEQSDKMQCLYLYYDRCLRDISALSKVKKTIKAIRIENCPKIEDFSVLGELENLELLSIHGSNSIPDLQFLKDMKNLTTFTFSANVLDGDLSPCLNLSYVYSEKNRKHYNLKDKDLPKVRYSRGNENIEEWRRLE